MEANTQRRFPLFRFNDQFNPIVGRNVRPGDAGRLTIKLMHQNMEQIDLIADIGFRENIDIAGHQIKQVFVLRRELHFTVHGYPAVELSFDQGDEITVTVVPGHFHELVQGLCT